MLACRLLLGIWRYRRSLWFRTFFVRSRLLREWEQVQLALNRSKIRIITKWWSRTFFVFLFCSFKCPLPWSVVLFWFRVVFWPGLYWFERLVWKRPDLRPLKPLRTSSKSQLHLLLCQFSFGILRIVEVGFFSALFINKIHPAGRQTTFSSRLVQAVFLVKCNWIMNRWRGIWPRIVLINSDL
jgi:hypothetical protein